MAKKTQGQMAVIRQMAALQKKLKTDVPEIYACMIKVLYDNGWGVPDIEDFVKQSQALWVDNTQMMTEMIDWVEETTGICVRSL